MLRLPDALRKKIKEESVRDSKVTKKQKSFFGFVEEFMIELNSELLSSSSSSSSVTGGKKSQDVTKKRQSPSDTNDQKAHKKHKLFRVRCFKCGKTDHKVRQCLKASSAEKGMSTAEWIKKLKDSKYLFRVFALKTEQPEMRCVFDFNDQEMTFSCIMDSGADVSVASMEILQRLRNRALISQQDVEFELIGGMKIRSSHSILVRDWF